MKKNPKTTLYKSTYAKNIWVQKNVLSKNNLSKRKIVGPRNFWSRKKLKKITKNNSGAQKI